MTREECINKINEINEELWELRRNVPDIAEGQCGKGTDEELYMALWNTCEIIERSANTLRQWACYVDHF